MSPASRQRRREPDPDELELEPELLELAELDPDDEELPERFLPVLPKPPVVVLLDEVDVWLDAFDAALRFADFAALRRAAARFCAAVRFSVEHR